MPFSDLDNHNIEKLLKEKHYDLLLSKLSALEPADAADIFETLEADSLKILFSKLDNETASEILSEIEDGELEDVVDAISDDDLSEIIDEMPLDEATDIIGELEDDEKEEVLESFNDEKRAEIEGLLLYDEDSAGGLMTPEFCAMNSNFTVQQAITKLTASEFSDPISMIFIVDGKEKLIGSIWVSNLLAKPKSLRLHQVMEENPICSLVDEDQEDIAYKFRKYDLYAMPVVDKKNILVGRITVDDVMDVIYEEADENMAHMAGAPDIEKHEESPFAIVRLRLPWILITMVAGLLISVIVEKISGLKNADSLAAFVPVIMAMGGNTGMQSSAVTIRRLALSGDEYDMIFKVFMRELFVGIMMGLVCGLCSALIVYTTLNICNAETANSYYALAGIVGFSMWVAMSFAATAGAVCPIILNKFKIDPAVASGPFITTGNDLAASVIYFMLCYILLTM